MGAEEKTWVVHSTLVCKSLSLPGASRILCLLASSVCRLRRPQNTHCVQNLCYIGYPAGPKEAERCLFPLRELDIRVAEWAKRAFDRQRCAILMY